MARTVFANTRNFSHQGSGDKSLSSAPDVCKTPIGNSTPPIPYAVMSEAGDLGDGSSSVKVDGNPTALANSNHSKCTGDEAGTAKGVGSGSTKDITEFTTYSFDVKVEGKGVVRHMDMSTMNKSNTIGMMLGSITSPTIIRIEESEADNTDTPAPIQIQFRLMLADVPGPNAHCLSFTPWKLAKGRMPEGMALINERNFIAEGETLNDGSIELTTEQETDLNKALKFNPNSIWLLYPGHAVKLKVQEEDPAWNDDDKLLQALNASDFSENLHFVRGIKGVETQVRYALQAFELTSYEELFTQVTE